MPSHFVVVQFTSELTPLARDRFVIGCLRRRPSQGSVAVEDPNFAGYTLLVRTRFALERPNSV